MARPAVLVNRSFATCYADAAAPVWTPLVALARLARSRAELPSFHVDEFMFMETVRNERRRLRIHLYKHIDTRRYLNLDDRGHAYAFRGLVEGRADRHSAGRYQGYRSVVDAIEHLQLWLFEMEPPLARSFPPETWPHTRAVENL